MASVRRVNLVMFVALLFGIVQPVVAQTGRAGALRVDGFDVEQVASLAPGTRLTFSIFATPGAAATVLIDGVGRIVDLREVEPGVYEGSYVLQPGDRVRSEGPVVATVSRQGTVTRTVLEEPLLLDGPMPAASPAARESVPRRDEGLRDGPAPNLPYARTGTAVPQAMAPVPQPPSAAPGYTPAPDYTPAPVYTPVPVRAPRFAAVPVPVGGSWPVAVPSRARVETSCADCVFVESIRTVEVASAPEHLGAIAGAVAGAVFGDQIGRAHARHVTRVLGALGGALIGHEIQHQAEGRTGYEATLRLASGARRVQRYDRLPPFRAGETIRLDPATLADAR